MSNADTIFAVVISGTPFEPGKWSFTAAERDEVVKRCHDEGHINAFLVSENLKAMGAKPPKPHPKPEIKAQDKAPEPVEDEPVSDHASLVQAVIDAKQNVKKAKTPEEKEEARKALAEVKAALSRSK